MPTLARLAVKSNYSVDADEEPATARPYRRVPEAIDRDWRDYVARFSAHYNLSQGQKDLAEKKLLQAEDKVALWLMQRVADDKTPEQTRKYASGEVKRKIPTAERVAEYRAKLQQIEQAGQKNYAFGRDVVKSGWSSMRAEAASLRTGLMKDLEGHYDDFRKDLDTVLTAEQKEKKALPSAPQNETLLWIDWLTRIGLTVIGACLLLGFLTRINAWLGAAFLFTTYLLMPAFLWLPAVGPVEGNPVFVNKNLIEMLALCVLGTIATGRWFGIDTFIHWAWVGLTGGGKPASRPEAVGTATGS